MAPDLRRRHHPIATANACPISPPRVNVPVDMPLIAGRGANIGLPVSLASRLSAGERDVRDAAGRTDGLHFEARLKFFEPVPEALPSPEDYGHDGYVHVVDQVGGKKLADSRRASADADVQAASGLPGDSQGVGRAGVDEVECRPALHLDRWPQ